MYKKNLLILGLLVFSACSQTKPEPKVEVAVKTPLKEPLKIPVQTAERIAVETEVLNTELTEFTEPTEFIPEHIRRSNIEVVKHY